MREFRIVVAAHSALASALLQSAELICGELREIRAVGIGPSQSPESFAADLRATIEDGPRPVLVLADLDGGTPSITAAAIAAELPDVRVLAGVNLGMLVEAATGLTTLDDAALEHLMTRARASIVDVTARLPRRGRS